MTQSYTPQHKLTYHPEEDAFVSYQLAPERMDELLSTSVDVRYPFAITFTSFLAGYLDSGATRGRKQIYIATMCLGLFLMREGMHRELKIATTVERVVVDATEGRQVKIANVRGKERLFENFKQVKPSQVPPPAGKSLALRIEDPENPRKMYYEIELGNAVICDQELL